MFQELNLLQELFSASLEQNESETFMAQSPAPTTQKPPNTSQAPAKQEQNQRPEEGVLTKLREATDFPLPLLNPEWRVPVIVEFKGKAKSGLLGFLSKKDIPPEKIQQLYELSNAAPGKALVEAKGLLKTNPGASELYMVVAMCQQKAIAMSSAGDKAMLSGLKNSTIYAARAMAANGFSVGNVDRFLNIYALYLDREKRALEKVKKLMTQLAGDRAVDALKNDFNRAAQTMDYLLEEYKRSKGIVDYLRKIFHKSSQRKIPFDYISVTDAVQSCINGDMKKTVLYGTAAEVVEHVYFLLSALAHVPMLDPVVEYYQDIFQKPHISMNLRWTSIQSNKLNQRLKQVSIQGKAEEMQKASRKIFELNMAMIRKLSGVPLKKDFEFDPFLNLARVTLASFQAFNVDVQRKMFETSMQALENCIKSDASGKNTKTQMALELTQRLTQAMDMDREAAKTEGAAPAPGKKA